jgi:hypothetical protein
VSTGDVEQLLYRWKDTEKITNHSVLHQQETY